MITAAMARWRETALGRGVARYGASNASRWAVVVAWQALFAFFPIILTLLTVLGLLLHGTSAADTIRSHVINSFPAGSDRESIAGAFDAIREHTGALAIVSLLSFIWGGSRLFGAIDTALDALFPVPPRSFVRQTLMAVGMMVVFTVLLVPVVMSASVIPALASVPDVPGFLTSGVVATLLQVGLGVVLGAVLFLAIYTIVPNRHVRMRRALPGALLAGVLLEVITLVFPVYFKLSHGFAAYGQTFALLFLLMNFFSWMGMVIMLGGSLNAALDPRSEPLPDEKLRLGGGLAQEKQPGWRRGEPGPSVEGGREGADLVGHPQRGASSPLAPAGSVVRDLVADLHDESRRRMSGPEKVGDAVARRPGAVWLALGLVASRLPARRRS